VPAGLTCAQLAAGSPDVCALAATSITIAAGAILSGRGARPLVLLGHTIDVEGTIDVAGHLGGPLGAAADLPGCNTFGAGAMGNGGGQGGTFSGDMGGAGGNSEIVGHDTGGIPYSTIGVDVLRGGCAGGPSNNGPDPTRIGHGGGAVWLAVDGGGSITIGPDGAINASGGGGAGGVAVGDKRGGYGGGSGGLIVLTAPTITLSPTAAVFADGGGGGGGASLSAGGPGREPAAPGIGGVGGAPGQNPMDGAPGTGGAGAPARLRAGANSSGDTNGAGGGGGGGGSIWITDPSLVDNPNVSPRPEIVTR
jgi:hypothetical protein